jgi:3-phosphoglycerate kinase
MSSSDPQPLSNTPIALWLSVFGRPDGPDSKFSLPIKVWLETAVQQSISFISSGFSPGEWVGGDSPVTLLENIRYQKGELDNDSQFAKEISTNADIYIYDAFASYNSAASLHKIPEILPTVPGLQFEKEIAALDKIVHQASNPKILIISGAKDEKLNF